MKRKRIQKQRDHKVVPRYLFVGAIVALCAALSGYIAVVNAVSVKTTAIRSLEERIRTAQAAIAMQQLTIAHMTSSVYAPAGRDGGATGETDAQHRAHDVSQLIAQLDSFVPVAEADVRRVTLSNDEVHVAFARY